MSIRVGQTLQGAIQTESKWLINPNFFIPPSPTYILLKSNVNILKRTRRNTLNNSLKNGSKLDKNNLREKKINEELFLKIYNCIHFQNSTGRFYSRLSQEIFFTTLVPKTGKNLTAFDAESDIFLIIFTNIVFNFSIL